MKLAKYQHGVSLADVIAWGTVLAFAVFITVKVLPSLSDFWKIKQSVAATATKVQPGDTPATIRRVFNDYANVEGVKRIFGDDLEIRKGGSTGTLIVFEYEDKIPLFANVSLLMEYRSEQPVGATRRTSSQE